MGAGLSFPFNFCTTIPPYIFVKLPPRHEFSSSICCGCFHRHRTRRRSRECHMSLENGLEIKGSGKYFLPEILVDTAGECIRSIYSETTEIAIRDCGIIVLTVLHLARALDADACVSAFNSIIYQCVSEDEVHESIFQTPDASYEIIDLLPHYDKKTSRSLDVRSADIETNDKEDTTKEESENNASKARCNPGKTRRSRPSSQRKGRRRQSQRPRRRQNPNNSKTIKAIKSACSVREWPWDRQAYRQLSGCRLLHSIRSTMPNLGREVNSCGPGHS